MDFEGAKEALREIARRDIATRPALISEDKFPRDIWKKLGAGGLLGLTVDKAYGGASLSFAELSNLSESFAEDAACPGMVMSWLGHNLMGRLLLQGVGTDNQKDIWLPKIASGEVTPSVAISEPKAGAHPKFLSTTAKPTEGGYEISGVKSFTTNGPIAGLFVVLAITGERNGRKKFSAFLVPGDAEGLTREPMERPLVFLHPAPHCQVRFEDVFVSQDAMLGPEGEGFDVISKRVRVVEDAVGLGSSVGSLRAQIRLLAQAMHADEGERDPAMLEALGGLIATAEALSVIGAKAAAQPDAGLPSGFRQFMSDAQTRIDEMRREWTLPVNPHFNLLTRDIRKGLSIASTAHKMASQRQASQYMARLADS